MTGIKENQPIAHIFNEALAEHKDVYWENKNQGKIFAEGFGQHKHQFDHNEPGHFDAGRKYGIWTIIPYRSFYGTAKVWGAGGGARGYDTGDAVAGSGGYSSATVKFLKDIPYTILVGASGDHVTHRHSGGDVRDNYGQSGTFGNGGGGATHGGSGGGLSGIFFNTFGNHGGPGHGHGANNTSFRSVGRQNALIIAGGGGGQGHHSTGHHGTGAAGGGTNGTSGHNAGGGSQTGGGGNWGHGSQAGYSLHGGHAGGDGNSGGGGGGWFGGAGGSHHSSHHNGGGGGSGHLLDLNSTGGYPNNWIKTKYPDLVTDGYSVNGKTTHQNHNINPGYHADSDWMGAGQGGGSQGQASGEQIFGRTGLGGGWDHSGYPGRVVISANRWVGTD
jgi:hypothetical protein